MPADTLATPAAAPVPQRHPPGLRTLFFIEMWERCSYYGMRAILILFLIDAVRGLGMSTKMAAAVYSLYTASVYLAALPGGWIADRFLGAQKAVWYGGILIAIGDFTLAVPDNRTFFLGLILIVMGTGLLKPNVSAIVAGLYPEGGGRRDAGFSIFYMGINLGAFIGPFICAALGENINWRLGLAAPGVGMIIGLLQYRLNLATLGESGKYPGHREGAHTKDWTMLFALLGAIALVTLLAVIGVIAINPIAIAYYTTIVIIGIAFLYFVTAFLFFKLDLTEKKRVVVIIVLAISSTMFWSGFEQAGSSFNLFAKRFTLRTRGFDFETFSTNDITNLPLLAGKLAGQTDDVSKYVWGTMSNGPTRELLTNYVQNTNNGTAKTELYLLRQFNKIIQADHPISKDQSFAGVKLSPQTEELLADYKKTKEANKSADEEKLVRVNRFLLEDAYPDALTQNQARQPIATSPPGFFQTVTFYFRSVFKPDFTMPAGWFQAVGPLFVIAMSPTFAALWIYLTRRNRNPSLPVKFGMGLIFLGLGFLVLVIAATFVVAGHKVGAGWLISVYFIHTLGEMCVSPVGLSSVTKLAPQRMVGQMMGIWFLATSLGNLIAGKIAGGFDPEDVDQMPALLMRFVITGIGLGLLMLIFSKPIKKLMVGVE